MKKYLPLILFTFSVGLLASIVLSSRNVIMRLDSGDMFGGDEIVDKEIVDKEVVIKKVEIIKTNPRLVNVNLFENLSTGEQFKEYITEKEYGDLAKKGAGQPTKDGYKWLGSYAGTEYDEELPVLKEGEYYISENPATFDKAIIKEGGIEQVKTQEDVKTLSEAIK